MTSPVVTETGILYAWCETCLEPVTKLNLPVEELDPHSVAIKAPKAPTVEPCGHGPNDSLPMAPAGAIGMVDLVGPVEGLPIPGISIRGFDPSRFASVPKRTKIWPSKSLGPA